MIPSSGGMSNQQSASSGASNGNASTSGSLDSSGWTVATSGSKATATPDGLSSWLPWLAAAFVAAVWLKKKR